MVQSQFSLSWESYKSSICNGFRSLQQNGEFVDMTLAADGHFVKVHQVLMALVSPYLKELIHSAPCQHPVIFLNNVTYKTLSCLLEYIYTGEVLVPSENLMSFVDTAKSLHIRGLEDLNSSGIESSYKVADNVNIVENSRQCHISGIKRLAVPSESGSGGQIGLPAAAKKVVIKYQKPAQTSAESKKASTLSMESDNNMNYSDMMDSTDIRNDDSDDGMDSYVMTTERRQATEQPSNNAPSSNLQFTVSIRGSLQVILNRYIYNLNSTSVSGVRRWRCVEYRNNRCKAFVVTKNNVVLNRANLHNHSFHDKKILQKIEKNAVFSALDDVKGYNVSLAADKDADSSAEQDNYVVQFPAVDNESDSKEWTVLQNKT